MKVVELKEELGERGEALSGNKAWLRRRLHAAIVSEYLESAAGAAGEVESIVRTPCARSTPPRSAPQLRRRHAPLPQRAALVLVPGLPRGNLAAGGTGRGKGAGAGERA